MFSTVNKLLNTRNTYIITRDSMTGLNRIGFFAEKNNIIPKAKA
jgi:hypothetical protein